MLVGGGTFAYPDPDPDPPDPNVPEPPHGHELGFFGHRRCWLFNPRAATWMEIAQLQPEPGREALSYEEQGGGRWYPTLLTMANGDVTAFFGHMKRASTWHLPTELRVYRGKTAPMAKQSGDPNIVCFSPLKLRPFLEISREAGVDHAAVLAIMAAPGLAVGARLRSDAISHARS